MNAQALAEQAGSTLAANIIMLGALARNGVLTIPRDAYERTIRTKTKEKFVRTNPAGL